MLLALIVTLFFFFFMPVIGLGILNDREDKRNATVAPAVSTTVVFVFDPFKPAGNPMDVTISAADRVRFEINDMLYKGAYSNRYPHDIWQG